MKIIDQNLKDKIINEIMEKVMNLNAKKDFLEIKWYVQCPNNIKILFCSMCESYQIIGLNFDYKLKDISITADYEFCSKCFEAIALQELKNGLVKSIEKVKEKIEEKIEVVKKEPVDLDKSKKI